ncbi:MAG: SGNH/GDSL hydrolase family protein [Clostridia bacterium]|nr:SGNH/GDSL hydrolase family protein [Clostridia bacterium]
MKKVVLMGDSIRMGYDKYVKEALEGVAEVYYPSENCKFAQYTYRFAHEWKKDGNFPTDADLVHWNAGLWDLIELGGDEPISTLDYYTNIIARVDKRLRRLYPNAKMVFATSTPVLEAKCRPDFRRHNSIIEQYNAAAIKALEGTGTIINDLYSIAAKAPESYHSDAVHYYTKEGTQLLGGQVLSVISNELGIERSEINIETFCPESYTDKNIGK